MNIGMIDREEFAALEDVRQWEDLGKMLFPNINGIKTFLFFKYSSILIIILFNYDCTEDLKKKRRKMLLCMRELLTLKMERNMRLI